MPEIWGRLGMESRLQFQNAVFPEGLTFTVENGFGTTASSPFLKVLRADEAEESPMARHPFTSWNSLAEFLRKLTDLGSILRAA